MLKTLEDKKKISTSYDAINNIKKTSKKVDMVTLFSFSKLHNFWHRWRQIIVWSPYLLKFKKMNVSFWYEFFIFSRSVFYFCRGTNEYFILHQKNTWRYCMHLNGKHKEHNSLEHLLKHSSFSRYIDFTFCLLLHFVSSRAKKVT